MILNLTQHPATAEQRKAGVVDLPPEQRETLSELLTFEEIPTTAQIADRAREIAALAQPFAHANAVMIGGAPFLMAALENAFLDYGITPLYAFSRRESVEETQTDGTVRKVNVFRHLGFVDAYA